MKNLVEKLKDAGANEWQKGGNHRLYISREMIAQEIGLTWSSYKTGNISSAAFNEKDLSNSKATKLLRDLTEANLYYNVIDGQFYWRKTDSNEHILDYITYITE